MPKKIIQDVYTPNKSIRMINKTDIRASSVINKNKEEEKKDIKIDNNSDKIFKKILKKEIDDSIINKKEKISYFSQTFLWVVSVLCVVFLVFLISSTFSTASVKITPKEQKISLDDTYNISKDPDFSGLKYDVMTLKKDLSKELDSDGEEYVEKKAIGKAVLYNNDSTSKQRLVNNTRLETDEGLIYRIRESVEIPGYKISGGVKTPGSVEVEIIADVAGDKYNMKLTDFKGDFKIPGFKGSPKYNTFYARLSADVLGGFIGNVKKVSDAKLNNGREELKKELKESLLKDIYAQKPDQLFFFNDNYYIQYNDLPDNSKNDKYIISEEATINVIVFNKEQLNSFISSKKIKDFDNSIVDVVWEDNLVSSLSGNTEKIWNEDSLKIKLSGNADVIWRYDQSKILSEIKGKNKNILGNILNENKNSIVEIQSTIRPQWKKTFPDNETKIKFIDTVRGS